MQEQPRGVRWIDSALADLRFGLRHIARKPISALTIVLVLALGIGFNAAIFLLIYSFVNSPPPGVTADESQVRIRGIDRSRGPVTIGREFSYPEYREYAAQQNLFSSVAAWTSADVVLDVGGTDEQLISGAATYVTSNYFQVLNVGPIAGAGLPTDLADVTATPRLVAVVSHVIWERHFNRAPDIVGKTMKVNGVPVTIAGVAPRRFAGARTGGSHTRVWVPLGARPVLQPGTTLDLGSYDSAIFGIVARLQPGVTTDQTLPAVQAVAARAAREVTRVPAGDARSTDVVPLRADNYFPPSGETPGVAGRLMSLMIPALILVITCTNVSALQAGLAVARRREIAVRLSLGASRAESRAATRDRKRTPRDRRRRRRSVHRLDLVAVVRLEHPGASARARLARLCLHVRHRAGDRDPVRPLTGPARHASRLVGRVEGQRQCRCRGRPLAAAVRTRRRADCVHAARAAHDGRADSELHRGSSAAPVDGRGRPDPRRALQHESAVRVARSEARGHAAAPAGPVSRRCRVSPPSCRRKTVTTTSRSLSIPPTP